MTTATAFQRPHVGGMPLIVMDGGCASAQAREADVLLYLRDHPDSPVTQIGLGTGHPLEPTRRVCESLVREGRLAYGEPVAQPGFSAPTTYRIAGGEHA